MAAANKHFGTVAAFRHRIPKLRWPATCCQDTRGSCVRKGLMHARIELGFGLLSHDHRVRFSSVRPPFYHLACRSRVLLELGRCFELA